MSRSQAIIQRQDVPEEYWVGRNVKPLILQRQSIYDTDILTIPLPVAEIQDGDSHYQRWDLDEPETH